MKKTYILLILFTFITEANAKQINLNIHEPIIGVKTITKQIVNCNKYINNDTPTKSSNFENVTHQTNKALGVMDRTGLTSALIGMAPGVGALAGYTILRNSSSYGDSLYSEKNLRRKTQQNTCTKQTQTYDINTVVGYNNCAIINGSKKCIKDKGYIFYTDIENLQ